MFIASTTIASRPNQRDIASEFNFVVSGKN